MKTSAVEHPSLGEVEALRREYQLLQRIQGEGVTPVVALEEEGARLVLVFEDRGHSSLKKQQPLTLEQFFGLAVGLSAALARIHQVGVMHCDINPSNIVIDAAWRDPMFIDFGLARPLETITQESTSFEGTLPYIAPEQTGRMNRALDERADLYSLGVTFFELLAGKLPLHAEDMLGWVHAHMTQKPAALCELRPDLPAQVCRIVMRLLEKSPEARYQSAYSLFCDLRQAQQQWEASGAITESALGAHDHEGRLSPPRTLIERDEVLASLLEEARSGGGIVIHGAAGLGKSALLGELAQRLEREALVVSVSCKAHRDYPMGAVYEVVGECLQDLIVRQEQDQVRWSVWIDPELLRHVHQLASVIPEVALVFGEGEGEGLSSDQSSLLAGVFGAINDHRRLVLCWDDIDALDERAFGVLAKVCTLLRGEGVSLVGTSLQELTAARLEAVGIDAEHFRHHALSPLSEAGTARWLAQATSASEAQLEELARVVYQQTQGNPGYINELVSFAQGEGLLAFELGRGVWRWHAEAIAALPLQQGLCEVLLQRLSRLPEEERHTLGRLACLGESFSLSQGEALCPGAASEVIASAVRQRVLTRREEEGEVRYHFAHDAVRHELYTTLPEALRVATHHALIAPLREELERGEERLPRLQALTTHMHQASEVLSEEERAARLEVEAELAAMLRDVGAYVEATSHYQRVYDALGARPECEQDEACRTRRFELGYALSLALYNSGQAERALALGDALLALAPSATARASVHRHEAAIYSQLGKLSEVILACRRGLSLLGVELPEGPEACGAAIEQGIGKLVGHIHAHTTEELAQMPPASDPAHVVSIEILSQMIPASFQSDTLLFLVAELTMFDISMTHGVTANSAFCYAGCGIILSNVLQDFDNAARLSQASLSLIERFVPHVSEASVYFLNGAFLQHLRASPEVFDDLLARAHSRGMKLGDIEHASYGLYYHVMSGYLMGHPLDEVVVKSQALGEEIVRLEAIQLDSFYQMFKGRLIALTEVEDRCAHLVRLYEARQAAGGPPDSGLVNLIIGLGIAFYWAGDIEQSWRFFEESLPLLPMVRGLLSEVELLMFLILSGLERLEDETLSEAQRAAIQAVLDAESKRLGAFARSNPDLYQPFYSLVCAEIARHDTGGVLETIIDLYTQAGRLSGSRYIYLRALASERHADLWLERGQERFARGLYQEAYQLYERWGARARLAHMEAAHPSLLAHLRPKTATPSFHSTISRTHQTTTTTSMEEQLDMESVIKATQALSSEVKSEKLFAALLGTIVENAGSQRTFLLLEERGEWIIAAHQLDGEAVGVEPIAFKGFFGISHDAVKFCMRTSEPLVLEDAMAHRRFARDPHISGTQVRSLMCVPIVQAGKLFGMLYAENNAMSHAFTQKHVKLMGILAGQAATSIQNVRVFEQLEARVTERTRALAQRNRETQALLDRLPQGVFTLDADLRIEPQYSARLPQMLGVNDLTGKGLVETLFEGAELSAEQKSMSEMAIRFSYGGPVFMTEINWEHIIRSFERRAPDGTVSSYEVDWTPIEDEFDDVIRVLVTLRDVTLLKQMEREAKAHEHESQVLQQILTAGLSDFESFASNTRARLEENARLVEASRECGEVSVEGLELLFRNLHTIKGNARVLGLSILSGLAHIAEEPIPTLRKARAEISALEALSQGMAAFSEQLALHETLLAQKLGRSSSAAPSQSELTAKIAAQIAQARAEPGLAMEVLACIQALIEQTESVPLEEVVRGVSRMFPSLSEEVGKPAPNIEIGGELRLKRAFAQSLNDALVHLFRNAFDHGIEEPQVRLEQGKSEQGTIRLDVLRGVGRQTTLCLSDDGRGLALSRLREKSGEQCLSDEEVAELIFASGTSTAEQVTSISGRGVGMDAVRSFLQAQGASISVEFTGPEHHGFRPFALVIALPREVMSSPAQEAVLKAG